MNKTEFKLIFFPNFEGRMILCAQESVDRYNVAAPNKVNVLQRMKGLTTLATSLNKNAKGE